MELVEGPTLADRIAQGPIPIDEALPIAKQIAEALEAAHEQGIIHRDLKPANIKVRPDGTVKVLDFGLAKALEPVSARVDATASPTITSPAMMTGVGVMLGTAAYMSPEQARGKAVDKRSDIWAFGCVLYEMLTGKRAFEDEDVSMTLSKVLQREPNFEASAPQTFRLTCARPFASAYESRLKERVPDIGDVSMALEGAFQAPVQAANQHAGVLHRPVWQRPALAALALASVALASAVVLWTMLRRDALPAQVARIEISLPPSDTLAPANTDHDLAVSRDGQYVVYRAARAGGIFLAIRPVNDLEARQLPGTDGSNRAGPFFSPDGAWVGFSDESDGTLKRVSTLGGPASRICLTGAGAAGIDGASWGDDGTIVFARGNTGGLWRVSASGGEPQELTKLQPKENHHAWPEILPGGRAVLFTILSGGIESAQIAVFDFETGRHRVLIPGGTYPRYVSTGHLVYVAGGTLFATPFDLRRLEVTGPPVPVIEGVLAKGTGAADFAVAGNGSLVYHPGGGGFVVRRTLVWVDRTGREEPLSAPARPYVLPRISPDGTRIAVLVRDQVNDIWVWDLARQTLTRLTSDSAVDFAPVWVPDSRRLILASSRAGASNLYWQAADGTGEVERLTESPNGQFPETITPDGRYVLFREDTTTETGSDISAVSLQTPRTVSPIVRTMFNDRNAQVSPDGRWLAYDSNESGREEIYVQAVPEVGTGRWLISTGGGRVPLWSRDSRQLFYLAPDGVLMAVRVEAGPAWRTNTPTSALSGEYFFGAPGLQRTFDISPDGRRFLMIKESYPDGKAGQNRLVLVQNWTEELKRLVPVN